MIYSELLEADLIKIVNQELNNVSKMFLIYPLFTDKDFNRSDWFLIINQNPENEITEYHKSLLK